LSITRQSAGSRWTSPLNPESMASQDALLERLRIIIDLGSDFAFLKLLGIQDFRGHFENCKIKKCYTITQPDLAPKHSRELSVERVAGAWAASGVTFDPRGRFV